MINEIISIQLISFLKSDQIKPSAPYHKLIAIMVFSTLGEINRQLNKFVRIQIPKLKI